MLASDWLRLLPMSGAGGRRSGDGGRWPPGAEGVTEVICQLQSILYFVIPFLNCLEKFKGREEENWD